jgi:hypothetical protein
MEIRDKYLKIITFTHPQNHLLLNMCSNKMLEQFMCANRDELEEEISKKLFVEIAYRALDEVNSLFQ